MAEPNWSDKFAYSDPVLTAINQSALGKFLRDNRVDLSSMERYERQNKGFAVDDVLELAPDESFDAGDYDVNAFRKLKASAATALFAAYAHENKIISFETQNAITYNEGPNSACGHLAAAVSKLICGDDESLAKAKRKEIIEQCGNFIETTCKAQAEDSRSVFSRAMRGEGKSFP